MNLTISILLAVAIDFWLGEPRNAYHPLVMFGKWAAAIEKRLLDSRQSAFRQRISGGVAVLLVLLPCLLWLLILPGWPLLQTAVEVLILYFCIAARSLQQHALAVHAALMEADLPLARQQVGRIVSRQTKAMTEADVRRAAIESVLENGADAVFAPLFWFVVLGPFGALLYRFSNTLDAMWGYKNQRYLYFGWAAARFDDLLNWLPARLTALSYALLGNTAQAVKSWRTQAHLLDSPNGGPVMTAGGGALMLQLGGPACYHGQIKQKPWFGGLQAPENDDIKRACKLMCRTLLLWLILIGLGDSLA
ncbi:adenosylcobinamide-phosphate synthase CbiB [Methylomonas rosea]|uniref:Cobalamin biosynthesis protein CobD n=1 Tax=Methylomonas rosea TaxID=2952227 RepID=A0ABT1TTT2_9GAMM|nr:adenosylcobinamide-phosphate synthase CbiB [Methylomonas sp. WSC-7]MCQ8117468.1 adenosylcobinamide-phosphate synthase CbiB [Methylomonas sp. WSC-7]